MSASFKVGGKEKDAKALMLVEGLSAETAQELNKGIASILSAPHCYEATKRTALEILGKLGGHTVSVSNATFQGPV